MGMVRSQGSTHQWMPRNSRDLRWEHSSSQSIELEKGCTQRSSPELADSSSSSRKEMVLQRRCILQ